MQQELEKYSALRRNHDNMIEAAEKELQSSQEEKATEPVKVRPDKDPTTKIGRAAMDVIERKKKRGRPAK